MKPALNVRLQRLATLWRARQPRERALLLVAGVASLLVLADTAVSVPLERRLKRERGALVALQNQLARRAAPGPAELAAAQASRTRAEQLQARVRTAQLALKDAELQARAAGSLPEMLRAIAATVGSARLLSLDMENDPAAADPAAARRVYRLPLTLKVSGSYFELQTLLDAVEQNAPALQWTALMLDGRDWPAVQMTLKAQVPSLSPRWGDSR